MWLYVIYSAPLLRLTPLRSEAVSFPLLTRDLGLLHAGPWPRSLPYELLCRSKHAGRIDSRLGAQAPSNPGSGFTPHERRMLWSQ